MRIGELSKLTGVSIRSLRYYDQLGLLRSSRFPNGYRDFSHDSVERVRLIQLYLGLGLNTNEIRRIFRCRDGNPDPERDGLCDELIEKYRERLREVHSQLDALLEVKRRLQQQLQEFERKKQMYERSESASLNRSR